MTPPDVAVLRAETGWLRGLAAQLVVAAQADDLAQDALHARCSDRPARAARGALLATVLRRRACDLARADHARAERERHAARPERLPPTVDAVLAVELQRELMALVLALDEPQRTCVLLRFWSGLPPREVARRLQVPVDELRVLDPDGRPMLLRVMRGQASFTNRKAAIVDGRTEVLSLGENATTAVIYRGGVEVARQPRRCARAPSRPSGF